MPDAPASPATVDRCVLFTDIVGSTRLWETEAERMRPALAWHDACCRDAVREAGGELVKTTGDGIHAAFTDALAAVQAALQIQQRLAAPPAGQLALQVRCGLHAGPCQPREGDYYGPMVNRAARVMAAAHAGQVLLTQVVAERLQGRLPAPLGLLDLGSVRLRDLSRPERVLQLLHPALRQDFAPLRSLESTPNNLPLQLNRFIGREAELARLRQLLGHTRLLTLLGMGGIGKSRLSVQLGAELLDAYEDGVWLVELAPLVDARQVPQALASVLGVKPEPGQATEDALAAHVRSRRLLVILDNCEHLLPACAALARALLQAGPGLTLLCSSRAALQLAGETVVPLDPLPVPAAPRHGDPAAASPAALLRHASVQLLLDRASAVRPDLTLDASNADAVALICRQLDGIPLALELAAARTRNLPVQAIAQRLHDRFRLLHSGDQTVLPRQRTLRALIDWSHELLDADERCLFARLAVFAGSFALESAEAVCGDARLDRWAVLDGLGQLVDKSLVVLDPQDERYRLLETVRAYALEKLALSGELATLQRRHAEQMTQLAEAAREHLAGPGQGRWLARLDAERDNLLAAQLAWHQWPDGAADGVRLLHALRPYWYNRGELSLPLQMAHDLLAHPALAARDEVRCKALFAAGQLGLLSGRADAALGHLEECLAIARERGALAIVGHVLQPLGVCCLSVKRPDLASRYLHEAVQVAEQMGNPHELAKALNNLAVLLRMQAEVQAAYPVCARAVEILRGLDDPETTGICLISLGMVATELGRLDEAQRLLAEAREIGRANASRPILLGATELACGLAAAQQHWQEAARCHAEVQAERAACGLQRDVADEAFVSRAMQRVEAARACSD